MNDILDKLWIALERAVHGELGLWRLSEGVTPGVVPVSPLEASLRQVVDRRVAVDEVLRDIQSTPRVQLDHRELTFAKAMARKIADREAEEARLNAHAMSVGCTTAKWHKPEGPAKPQTLRKATNPNIIRREAKRVGMGKRWGVLAVNGR